METQQRCRWKAATRNVLVDTFSSLIKLQQELKAAARGPFFWLT